LSKNELHKLPFDQNYLHFEFINTDKPNEKSFLYQLTGSEYSWIECNNCSDIFYAHLDGGKYTFQIKTNNLNSTITKFDFEIEGNVLHKWWFIPSLFLYLIALIAVVVYFMIVVNFRQKLKNQELVFNEKMKSMGELSSGISHEIQNPLNFVNNFADLSIELGKELASELDKAKIVVETKDYLKDILSDLNSNLTKIATHGARASKIVKGMQEHSNYSKNEKEQIDLNQLINENVERFLKNKKVNFKDTFGLQPAIGLLLEKDLAKVKLLRSEFGKVIDHMLSNAFYATKDSQSPMISIATEKVGKTIIIKISDNGTGISEATKAKIFQPFFTTKPAGEGTGLGLSLVYDIITKGHGGTIEVESVEGEGTTFVLKLPIKNS
jgi:signal transduction histidine kinase